MNMRGIQASNDKGFTITHYSAEQMDGDVVTLDPEKGTPMTNLAQTIPATAITHGKGEPVFPELYRRLAKHPELLQLAKEREQFGITKYGQTLMTGDDRDTATEIMNEALDLLAYLQKWTMRHGNSDLVDSIIIAQIGLVAEMLRWIKASSKI